MSNEYFSDNIWRKIKNYPRQSREEELLAFKKLSSGSVEEKRSALEGLILSNLAFAFYKSLEIAKKHTNYHHERASQLAEDLFQDSIFALYIAISKFDVDRNVRFRAYAENLVRQVIDRSLRKYSSTVTFPFNNALAFNVVSFNQKLSRQNGNKAELTIESLLEYSQSPPETAIKNESKEYIESSLKALPKDLEPVIRMRFGIGSQSESDSGYMGRESTLDEVAEVLKATREGARQKEDKALEELRYKLASLS